jgi:hypothetical protein
MSWSEGAAELVGTLRRKKEDHGMFEDPWKKKVFCWLSGNMLNMRNASDQSGQETFELGKWDLIVREKGKFILKRVQGDYQVQLKAESPAEADLWVQKLTAATAAAKNIANSSHLIAGANDRAQQDEVSSMRENSDRLEMERVNAERASRERQAAEQAERERAEHERMLTEQRRQAQLIAELANREAIERARLAEIARVNAEREAAERAQQAEMVRQNAEREAARAHQAELEILNAEREAAERAQQSEWARLNEEQEAQQAEQNRVNAEWQQAEEFRVSAEREAAAQAQQAEEARMKMQREAAEAAAERSRQADMSRLNFQQEVSNSQTILQNEPEVWAQPDHTSQTVKSQGMQSITIMGLNSDQGHPVQPYLVPRVQQGVKATSPIAVTSLQVGHFESINA